MSSRLPCTWPPSPASTDLLLPALEELLAAFRNRQTAFGDVTKIGRTHLMDAVPLTVGQEISGWAHQIAAGRDRVIGTLDGLFELALGGTAVGTGLNAPPGFANETIRRLAEATGQPFRPAHATDSRPRAVTMRWSRPAAPCAGWPSP